MNRLSLAFRSFFSILFSDALPSDIALAYGYTKPMPAKSSSLEPKPTPVVEKKAQAGPNDGAVQLLSLLQREGRLVDFLMEDITAYSDDQVGAAVRDVHAQTKKALERYLKIAPVIDGVEGDFTKTSGMPAASVRLIGNVPPDGKAAGGLLRHKGWKAEKIDLPAATAGQILTPAEVEVE